MKFGMCPNCGKAELESVCVHYAEEPADNVWQTQCPACGAAYDEGERVERPALWNYEAFMWASPSPVALLGGKDDGVYFMRFQDSDEKWYTPDGTQIRENHGPLKMPDGF